MKLIVGKSVYRMRKSVFKKVLQRYQDDFRKEGAHSYDYKLERINK